MYSHLNLTGQTFGRLTILGLDVDRSGKGKRYYVCRCICGDLKSVLTHALRSGVVKSCGCLNRDPNTKKRIKHGMSHSLTYNSWHSMKQRCYSPKNISYRFYGALGITVCDRWLKSFKNFLEDMGERPAGKTLDRIKSDQPYFKENCRWATDQEQQSENKTGLHIVEIEGEKMTLTEASRRYSSVSVRTVFYRIDKYKWNHLKAILTPNIQGQKK